MKTIKIPTTDIEIPLPEFMNDGWWNVEAEWKLGKLSKVVFERKD